MKIESFLFFCLLILFGCDELAFTDIDDKETTGTKKSKEDIEKPLNNSDKDNSIVQIETESDIAENKTLDEISEEETTLISEDMELTKDTVLQNRKVILDMITIKTFEHSLIIIAEEFVSNHSVIQNFPEGQKAKKSHHGRDGGNIQVEAKTAKGELQLILSGEDAGSISPFRHLSKKEKEELKGHDGENGYNAVYRDVCQNFEIPIIGFPIAQDCWQQCAAFPTVGDPGGNGRPGLPGFSGKNGGDSGSFHLKAFELSDFHLMDIKQTPGEGSKGSKGSPGGAGGRGGENGKDEKDLCNDDLPSRRKDGKRGSRGAWGKKGQNGKKGTICLEKLLKEKTALEDENPKKESVVCY